jgi:cell division protein FtsI (penicillin-binding protein 3)
VVHKPSTVNNNYYGADVAGPVLKELQKILQMFLRQTKLKNIDRKVPKQEKNYNNYFAELPTAVNSNVKGMPGMDAIALLENLGVKVKVGMGR